MIKPYYTLKDAAENFGIGIWAMRQWIRIGRLKAYKPGKQVLVRGSELVDLLERSKIQIAEVPN